MTDADLARRTPRRLMKAGVRREDLVCVHHPDRPWDGEAELSGTCVCAECRWLTGVALRAIVAGIKRDLLVPLAEAPDWPNAPIGPDGPSSAQLIRAGTSANDMHCVGCDGFWDGSMPLEPPRCKSCRSIADYETRA